MDMATQPFLFEDDEKHENFIHSYSSKKSSLTSSSWVVLITTHVTFALLVLFAFNFWPFASLTTDKCLSQTRSQPTLYSPLEPVIKYKIDTQPEDWWSNDLYFGDPTPESERAWNRLIHPHGIQISPEEAAHMDTSNTLSLKNGNAVFILGLYHNLHCLRRIRQSLNADYYYPNMTDVERKHDLDHNSHCLEAIRTSMLCNPDLTPNRYFWSGRYWHDLSVGPDVERECVDWSAVQEFMDKRSYDPVDIVKGDGTEDNGYGH